MSNRHAKSLKRDMPLYGGWLLSRLSERAATGVVWAIGAESKIRCTRVKYCIEKVQRLPCVTSRLRAVPALDRGAVTEWCTRA